MSSGRISDLRAREPRGLYVVFEVPETRGHLPTLSALRRRHAVRTACHVLYDSLRRRRLKQTLSPIKAVGAHYTWNERMGPYTLRCIVQFAVMPGDGGKPRYLGRVDAFY